LALILSTFAFTPRADWQFTFPGWLALAPTLGSAMLIASIMSGESTLSKLLSTKPLTMTGKISYSLYLWHWPLIIFGKMNAQIYNFSENAGAVGGGVCSIFAAIFAYLFIERPLRRRGPGRKKRLFAIALIFAGTLALCTWNAWLKPFRTFPQFAPVTASAGYYNFRTSGEFPELPKAGVKHSEQIYSYDTSTGEIAGAQTERKTLKDGGLLHLYSGGTPRVVVWGSSHAIALSPMIDQLCRDKKLSVAFFGKAAELPFLFTSSAFPEARRKAVQQFFEYKMKWIKEWNPDVLFLIDRWDRMYSWDKGDLTSFKKQFEAFLEMMKPFKTKVVFVAQVPVSPHGELLNFRALTDFLTKPDGTPPVLHEPAYFQNASKAMREVVEDVAKRHPNLMFLRADLCFLHPDGSLRYFSGDKFFYFDEDHLSDAGAQEMRPVFEQVFSPSQAASRSQCPSRMPSPANGAAALDAESPP
jgi:hypothetical protein